MIPAVILDADLVLLDFVQHFVSYMRARHGIANAVPWEQEAIYDLKTMYPSLPRSIRSYFEDMSCDPEWYSCIPFLDGAAEAIAMLRSMLPDTRLVCVTSGGNGGATRALRLRNLEPLRLDEVVTLPLYSSKAEAYATFAPGCWVVDDLPLHIEAAEQAGHHGILFDHPYNRWAQVRHRAMNWSEITALITRDCPPEARLPPQRTAA